MTSANQKFELLANEICLVFRSAFGNECREQFGLCRSGMNGNIIEDFLNLGHG